MHGSDKPHFPLIQSAPYSGCQRPYIDVFNNLGEVKQE